MAKKTASKKKRTAAQKRATARLVALNKKKRASKKTASRKKVARRRVRRAPRRQRSTTKIRGYPGGARRTNPWLRQTYAIVKQDVSAKDGYRYFDGTKFVEKPPYLLGPQNYMKALAQHVADEYPNKQVFVKEV